MTLTGLSWVALLRERQQLTIHFSPWEPTLPVSWVSFHIYLVHKQVNKNPPFKHSCGVFYTLFCTLKMLGFKGGLWKTIRRFLKKLKTELPYDATIPILGKYPKEVKPGYRRDICSLMFIAALFTIAKIRKQPKHPSNSEQIKKVWCIYIQWNIIQP